MTAVLFGNPEEALIVHLQGELEEHAGDRVGRPTKELLPFVVVERLGGPRSSLVTEDATITVESWAETWAAAWELAQRARRSVHGIAGQTVGGITFYTVKEFAGPGRLRDPISNFPRVVFTVSVRARCLAA